MEVSLDCIWLYPNRITRTKQQYLNRGRTGTHYELISSSLSRILVCIEFYLLWFFDRNSIGYFNTFDSLWCTHLINFLHIHLSKTCLLKLWNNTQIILVPIIPLFKVPWTCFVLSRNLLYGSHVRTHEWCMNSLAFPRHLCQLCRIWSTFRSYMKLSGAGWWWRRWGSVGEQFHVW